MDKARHYCRFCRTKLSEPEDNDRQAFCTRGCHSSFYRHRCVVCEKAIERVNERKKTCDRRPCINAHRTHPDSYGYLRTGVSLSYVAEGGRSARKQGLELRLERGLAKATEDGWRQIAGPKLSPTSFWLATLPLDPATAKRVAADNARFWAEARKAVPLNLLGGHSFPDATKLEIGLDKYILALESALVTEHAEEAPPLQPEALPVPFTGDPLDIPAFLDRKSPRGP